MSCAIHMQDFSTKIVGDSDINEAIKVDVDLSTEICGVVEFTNKSVRLVGDATTICVEGEINNSLSSEFAMPPITICGEVSIPDPLVEFALDQKLCIEARFDHKMDKFAGEFRDFECYDKLVPIADSGNVNFIGFNGYEETPYDLHAFIDDGVYMGDYTSNGVESYNLYNDCKYIKTTDVESEFKCKVSNPRVSFRDSNIVFRVAAPPSNQIISDIRFEDPNGNLICEYDSIEFIGDGGFVTISANPSINNGGKYTWDDDYPAIDNDGYVTPIEERDEDVIENRKTSPIFLRDFDSDNFSLSFKTSAACLSGYDGFADGFDEGFEFCSQLFDPTLKISAVEICNSGDFGFRNEDYLSIFTEVQTIGERIQRCLNPTNVLAPDFATSVWPSVQSVWTDGEVTNETEYGRSRLTSRVSKGYDFANITLDSTSIADSGKLHLEFSNQADFSFGLKGGAFSMAFVDEQYDVARGEIKRDESWFVVDEISLKVRAKKAEGSRDYTLDVVGWSDDRLLNVTTDIDGFLQNVSGLGDTPLGSGYNDLDDEAITGESISDKSEYFLDEVTSGGDHYELYENVVNSTTFQEYIVPLQINKQNIDVGDPVQYNSSSYFEKLFLDIYPLPSGASISSIELCITYKPSNAFTLSTVGGNLDRITDDREESKIIPVQRDLGDDIINKSNLNYSISNIPHGYDRPDSLKSNFSRRWTGLEGLVSGPFNPNEFGFGFENPQLDSPFIDGFFDFNNISGNVLLSRDLANMTPSSGVAPGPISIIPNIGLRFKNPVISNFHSYESIAFDSDMIDAYANVFEADQEIAFANVSTGGGFAFYVRFSKGDDVNTSRNIVSSDDDVVRLQFNPATNLILVSFKNGDENFDAISYTLTEDVVYPFSVVVTHNDNNSDKMKLYIKTETSNLIKVESSETNGLGDTVSNFTLNSSNHYIHELGFSSADNLVDGDYDSPNLRDKQQTVQSFLESRGISWLSDTGTSPGGGEAPFTLPSYIDEDTGAWDLGAFAVKEFAAHEFDIITKRVGRDVVNFTLANDGQPYSDKADLTLPSTIDGSVSYHTQIENDFLRFNLSNAASNLHSVAPRISKALPRGYDFNKDAIVVESIVDYEQEGDIVWDNGQVGPKLIVSLYTTAQEPFDYPTTNYGLVNRKSHYLAPGTCFKRLDSVFDQDSFFDETEAWSVFPEERRLSEFDHKYYSSDIDKMFLQYDLVVPSGQAYKIDLNIHAANVRLKDAFVLPSNDSNSLNLAVDADQIAYSMLDFQMDAIGATPSEMILHTSGIIPGSGNEYMSLQTSGIDTRDGVLTLHTYLQLEDEATLPLVVPSGTVAASQLNLLAFNDQTTLPSDLFMPLQMYATQSDLGMFTTMPLVAYSSLRTDNMGDIEESLGIKMFASSVPVDLYSQQEFNLHTLGPNSFGEVLNLHMSGEDADFIATNARFNLHSVCNPPTYLNGSGSPFIEWNSSNFGSATTEDEEFRFDIQSSDIIRDVDTICWGDCSNEVGPCTEQPLVTHGIDWLETDCVNGGVLRASAPYFNSEVLAFGDADAGTYEGHYHGLRKYTGLFPNTAYRIFVEARTGSLDSLPVPREFEEWEYGTLGDIDYTSNKLTEEVRASGNFYGRSISVKDNLLAVGSPNKGLGDFVKAGAVDIYRRETLSDPGAKGAWNLEDTLILPSGYSIPHFNNVDSAISYPGIGTIQERQWSVGQNGRELGYSIDIASSGDRELVIAGAPGALWDSTAFTEIETSGVNVGLVVFNNEFVYNSSDIDAVLRRLDTNNFLYKYFADPAVQINLKIIVCIPVGIFDTDVQTNSDVDEYLTIQKIPRRITGQPSDPVVTAEMLSGIQEGFFKAFPYDETKVNNNIPPVVGFYVDNSRSLGRGAVEPAVDQFVNFYENYSFESGVKDFYGNQASGHMYEYVPTVDEGGEEWFNITNSLMDELLDTGRLVEGGYETLITSGVGLEFANENAVDFNTVPDSGGRAFIFEKEGGDWTLIQELKSTQLNEQTLSRFGHSVSISDDGTTVAVGSPFTKDACNIYLHNTNEKLRLYSRIGEWLNFRNLSTEFYDEVHAASGLAEANRAAYLNLSHNDRYWARTDSDFWVSPIEEFKLDYTYGNDDVISNITGTFTVIPASGSPNPRMGYSSSVSEDGSLVAFGAPTDSLGLYENSDFYFLHSEGRYVDPSLETNFFGSGRRGLWASNLHAGAVRIFGKDKKIVPTDPDKFYEYNRFGNLSNTLNNTESFNELGEEVTNTVIAKHPKYNKLPFSQSSIPEDAATLFIITPEIDAANDEVITAIKDWLALGDRKLVLVGDDPTWENNGAYAQSNKIINTILEKLDSRMRLHGARTQAEALLVNNECEGSLKTNVIESYAPVGGNATSVDVGNDLHGYGVADIRFHMPELTFPDREWGKDHVIVDNKMYGKCSAYNNKCGPPIAHEGDLRARWTEREERDPPTPKQKYTYWERNLPFEFFSQSVPSVEAETALEITKELSIVRPGEQPRPLMVAAEFTENFLDTPEQPEIKQLVEVYETITREVGTPYTEYEFSEVHAEQIDFIWSEESGVYNFVDTNIKDNENPGVFFNPDGFNGRDGLLQASGLLNIETEEFTEYFNVDEFTTACAKQEIFNSQVYLIAMVESESQDSLSFGNDENISFYDNMIRNENCDNANVLQLGGWTGTNTFKEGYSESRLKELFEFLGHNVQEGWVGQAVPASKNVAWIANASNEPSDQEAAAIVDWLQHTNKKLVITYDGTQEKAAAALATCNKLGLAMKPWYLEGAAKYPVHADQDDKFFERRNNNSDLILGEDQSIDGCGNEVTYFKITNQFIPINAGPTDKILYYEGDVKDQRLVIDSDSIWKMNTGVAQVQFPAIPGSGYRIFYNWFSDNPGEQQEIDVYFGDIHYKRNPTTKALEPSKATPNGNIAIYDYDINDQVTFAGNATVKRTIKAISFGETLEDYIDVQVPHNKDYINLFLTGNRAEINTLGSSAPQTCKFLAVSGCPLPIIERERILVTEESENVVVGYEEVVVQPYVPAKRTVLPATVKPIMTDNTKYCVSDSSCGGKLVADGPVVMAEEDEHFSDFIFGNERSKIVLISDSTMINGCLSNIGNIVDGAPELSGVPTVDQERLQVRTNQLINSLITDNSDTLVDGSFGLLQKIVSPEVGSPSMYGSAANTSLARRFGGFVAGNAPLDFAYEKDFNVDSIIATPSEEDFEDAEERVVREFESNRGTYGVFSRMIHDGYQDSALRDDPTSQMMKDTGKDFLDYEFIGSGYPGDLFGHSVDIRNGTVVVGSPYAGWSDASIVEYSGISDFLGLELGDDGGAGAAYVFTENPQTGWTAESKLRPTTINSNENSDRFGWDVALASDFVAVGSPGHDYINEVSDQKGEFVRKEFGASFGIGNRIVADTNTAEEPNLGAVYTYENKMYDFATRSKEWTFAAKVVADGHQYYEEFSNFGAAVDISRFARTDSDYALAVGSYQHGYKGVGDAFVEKAGAAYTFDAMLREQPSTKIDDGSWLKASVFGQSRSIDNVQINISDVTNYESNTSILESGIVYSDNKGQVLIEASGQDPREYGYINQRPYIHRVYGTVINGDPSEGILNMATEGAPHPTNAPLNLYIGVDESGIEYNTLNIQTVSAWRVDTIVYEEGCETGLFERDEDEILDRNDQPFTFLCDVASYGLPLNLNGEKINITSSGSLPIHMDAIGIVDNADLDLRIRGK